MKHVVLGTAGHVDHGKTSLVHRITGHNTDRLKEEVSRGITIELGFAPFTLRNGQRVGIVDVPGHERFIKNMLAGATGIDIVLLVIAADEGIMPQTREHLDILRLLGVDRGIVVLTKIDMIDNEWLQLVREDVSEFLQGSPFCESPIVEISSVTGQGIPELLDVIEKFCETVKERPATGVCRLAVDRVFTMSGFGTVVTGTLWGGSIKQGDSLELLPARKQVRVRSLQVHGEKQDEAFAGQRVAVNLANVEKEFAERGSWLATPGALRESRRVDIRLSLLDGAPKMAQHTRVRVHHGTTEVLARVKLLDADVLLPGESCFVQLELEEPLSTLAGDRVVLRHYSPMFTIGGGTVLEPGATRHKGRVLEDSVARLEALHSGDNKQMLIAAWAKKVRFWELSDIVSALQISDEEARQLTEKMVADNDLLAITDKYFYPKNLADRLCEKLTNWLSEYFAQWPMRFGVAKSEVAQIHFPDMDQKQQRALFSYLDKTSLFEQDETSLWPAGWQPKLNEKQLRVVDAVRQLYAQSPFSPPPWSEAVSALKIPDQGEILQWFLRSGEMVRVADNVVFMQSALNEAESILRAKSGSGGFTLAEARDFLETPRKFAQIIVEYFDLVKLTHWDGQKRFWR